MAVVQRILIIGGGNNGRMISFDSSYVKDGYVTLPVEEKGPLHSERYRVMSLKFNEGDLYFACTDQTPYLMLYKLRAFYHQMHLNLVAAKGFPDDEVWRDLDGQDFDAMSEDSCSNL